MIFWLKAKGGGRMGTGKLLVGGAKQLDQKQVPRRVSGGCERSRVAWGGLSTGALFSHEGW